jgi:hypothetical protein
MNITSTLSGTCLEREASDESDTLPDCMIEGNAYKFGKDGNHEIIITNSRQSREEASRLVFQAYLRMGYIKPNPAQMRLLIHDASPATTTFLVRQANTKQAMSGLTITPDSPLGLPMEKHHSEEIQLLRESGYKLCETGKLVSFSDDTENTSIEVLMHTFKLAYLIARHLEGCTHLVIEVRPHHVGFYRKMLCFECIGPERTYDTVNGKVISTIPLSLNIRSGEERLRSKFGNRPGPKNLARFFMNDAEPFILSWLRRERQHMSALDFYYFFMEQTHLYQETSPDIQLFLRNSYMEQNMLDKAVGE